MNALREGFLQQSQSAHPFLATLDQLRPTAIAVYGLGVVAHSVLEQLANYPVVGLMDKDPANRGRIFYGQPVLGDDEVMALGVRAIIIAASDVYWRTIACRIAPLCRIHGIHTVFLNGELVTDASETDWGRSLGDGDRTALEREIARHEVVSFDLFETLVTRLASRPDDLLELAVTRTRAETGAGDDLLGHRRAAEEDCRTSQGAYVSLGTNPSANGGSLRCA